MRLSAVRLSLRSPMILPSAKQLAEQKFYQSDSSAGRLTASNAIQSHQLRRSIACRDLDILSKSFEPKPDVEERPNAISSTAKSFQVATNRPIRPTDQADRSGRPIRQSIKTGGEMHYWAF